MRSRFVVSLVSAAFVGLLACAGARGQNTKIPPCGQFKGDAAKYTDCMDTREIERASLSVLGRAPTAAEIEKWKRVPPIKTTGHPEETRYVTLLLNWLIQPAQGNERLAVVDRAYHAISPTPATITQRTHWATAIRDQRLTYTRVWFSVLPDLTVAELKGVPDDATAIMVRVANLSQWSASGKSELSWNLAGNGCEHDIESRLLFPVPSIPSGKDAWVKVKSTHRLHGLIHVGYLLRIYATADKDEDNSIKCVKSSTGTKATPTGAPPKIPPPLGNN